MSTRYVGLFCPDRHFNILETYEVANLNAPVQVHWVVDRAQRRCEHCGKVFSFQQKDVAHANFRDGTDARYPHELAAWLHAQRDWLI